MAPKKRLKGTLTTAEFQNMEKALDETPSHSSQSQGVDQPPQKKIKMSPKSASEGEPSLTGERYEWCWEYIIKKHVSFPDILSLVGTDKTLKRIAGDFLKITSFSIDQCFIDKYPIKDNRLMFSTLGKFIEILNISSLNEEAIKFIFKHFPNLLELTMSDVCIYEAIHIVPENIRKLKLEGCSISKTFLKISFPRMCKNLTRAHFSRNYDCFDSQEMSYGLLSFLRGLNTHLRYLYIEGAKEVLSEEIPLERLEHLQIKSVEKVKFGSKVCLEYLLRLEIDFADWENRELHSTSFTCYRWTFPAIKLLTLRYPPNDPERNNLSLKLISYATPDEWLQSERLHYSDNQNIEMKIIRCSSEEERLKLDPSGENLLETISYDENPKSIEDDFIFNRLNDDCLLKIVSYLSLTACLNLANTHKGFHRIFKENVFSRDKHSITDKFTMRFPVENMKSAYDIVFKNLVSLTLRNIRSRDALKILSCCQQLKHLVCEDIELIPADKDNHQMPKNLVSLELNFGRVCDSLWAKWCKQLSASLQVLTICDAHHQYGSVYPVIRLLKLKNIREFRFCGTELPSKLKEFLLANQDTLELLQLQMTYENFDDYEHEDYRDDEEYDNYKRGFSGMEQLSPIFPSLKKLKVLNIAGFKSIQEKVHLPSVIELTIHEWLPNIIVDFENLRTLRIMSYCVNNDREWKIRLGDMRSNQKLEHLEIRYEKGHQGSAESDLNLVSMMSLKSLRHLSFAFHAEMRENKIMEIIRKHSQISRLSTNKSKFSLKFKSYLERYLEMEQREFRLNNVVFDGRGGLEIVKCPLPLQIDQPVDSSSDSDSDSDSYCSSGDEEDDEDDFI